MKKVLTAFLYIVIALVLLFNICSRFNIPFLGFRVFRVGSGSMSPYLEVNNIIVVKSNKTYKINDVVTYINDGNYITHRIISISNEGIITKGDANNTEDALITKDDIVGKVVLRFKFLGYIFSLRFSWIWIFIVGLIITILIPDKKKHKELKI